MVIVANRVGNQSACVIHGNYAEQQRSNIKLALTRYFMEPSDQNVRGLMSMFKSNGIKAVCFDMDGTLVDTEEAGWQVILKGCKNENILSSNDMQINRGFHSTISPPTINDCKRFDRFMTSGS